MSEQHSLFDTITNFFVPVHPDGVKFLAIAFVAMLLGFWIWPFLGWVMAIITAYIAYFFRDPARMVPQRPGLVVAPADGKVSAVELAHPPEELEMGPGERLRISIFLSVFDVHVNRMPVGGVIETREYTPGLFLNADLDKASEDNERCGLVIRDEADDKEVAVVQIAGLIARRIVTPVREGQSLQRGERFGLIRFGSRVDVYLPTDAKPLVAVGQRAIGGETVLCDFGLHDVDNAVVEV